MLSSDIVDDAVCMTADNEVAVADTVLSEEVLSGSASEVEVEVADPEDDGVALADPSTVAVSWKSSCIEPSLESVSGSGEPGSAELDESSEVSSVESVGVGSASVDVSVDEGETSPSVPVESDEPASSGEVEESSPSDVEPVPESESSEPDGELSQSSPQPEPGSKEVTSPGSETAFTAGAAGVKTSVTFCGLAGLPIGAAGIEDVIFPAICVAFPTI